MLLADGEYVELSELGESGEEVGMERVAATVLETRGWRAWRGFFVAGGELGGEWLLLSELLLTPCKDGDPAEEPADVDAAADAAAASASSSGTSLAWPLMWASISFLFLNVSSQMVHL